MAAPLRVVIGISGGIAAYKIPQLIRLLTKQNVEVKTVITSSAEKLVGEDAVRTVSSNPVYGDKVSFFDMDHIRLADWADLYLICPATANTIAKITHGIADNLLTTLALSVPETKIAVVPAMNTVMWQNMATQANIKQLESRGVFVFPVDSGELACGSSGLGRMVDIEDIAEWVIGFSKKTGVLSGKNVLISSGPTEEAIDPVRVITNRSTGKMGAALAREALALGANVTVVSGPSQEKLPIGAEIINIRTACQMQDALLSKFDAADICIMAAAVSDFRVENYSETKIQKNENGNLVLELKPNPDILEKLGKTKKNQFLVGFALENNNSEDRARLKMEKKGCDMMIYNNFDSSLGLSTTRISILAKNGFNERISVMSKSEAAGVIFKNIIDLSGSSNG